MLISQQNDRTLKMVMAIAMVMMLLVVARPSIAETQTLTCQQALTNSQQDPIQKSRIFGKLVQQSLKTIYQSNTQYQQDFDKPGHLLSDGKVGRVTQKWILDFCENYIEIAEDKTDAQFVTQLIAGIVTIAELFENYPSWQQDWQTDAFKSWWQLQINAGQFQSASCLDRPVCYGNPTVLHQIFDSYYLQTSTVEQPQYFYPVSRSYYQLNDDDIKVLQDNANAIGQLEALVGTEFKTDQQIGEKLTPIVTELASGKSTEQISQLLDNLVVVKPVASSGATTATSATDAQTSDSAAASQGSSTQAVQPVQNSYQVTAASIKQLIDDLSLTVLTKEQLAFTTVVTNKVFISEYLFTLALLSQQNSQQIVLATETLAKIARKEGKAPSTAASQTQPLVWQGMPGCGCTDTINNAAVNRHFYYGFYPYWLTDEVAEIDYTQLTRIAYVSATIEAGELQLPHNWQGGRPYSEFAVDAHNHQVKVDLVATNRTTVAGQASKASVFDQALIDQLVAAVHTPLVGYPINTLKPWMSFGISPKRTLGDGLTLDLDMSQFNPENLAQFVRFVAQLHQSLNANDSAVGPASYDDRYYLNMVIPADRFEDDDEHFYTVANLMELEPYIHLFMVKFPSDWQISQRNADKPKTQTNSSSSINLQVDQLKLFRTYLGEEQYTDTAGVLFKKILPMIDLNIDFVGLGHVFNYAKWSYLGAAFWSLPIDEQRHGLIEQTYFSQPQSQYAWYNTLAKYSQNVCDALCPLRWPLRVAFLSLVWVLLIFVIASIWFYRIRAWLVRWYVLAFIAIATLFIMLVFACDPYWKEQQQLLLFGVVLFMLVLFYAKQLAKRAQDNLP